MQEIKSTPHDAIVDFFLDFRAYISNVFGGDLNDATLDWNSVGACFHYFGEDCQPLLTDQVPGCRIVCIRL